MSRRENRTVIEPNFRKPTQLELLIRELSIRAANLDSEIAAEDERSGDSNPEHTAYASYIKVLAQRRDNLLRTVEMLKRGSRAKER